MEFPSAFHDKFEDKIHQQFDALICIVLNYFRKKRISFNIFLYVLKIVSVLRLGASEHIFEK